MPGPAARGSAPRAASLATIAAGEGAAPVLPFAGAALDRLEGARGADGFAAAGLPRARLVLVAGGLVPVRRDERGEARALLLEGGERTVPEGCELVVLGARDGELLLAAELASAELAGLVSARGGTLAELKPLAAVLPVEEAGLLAYASALLHWHSTSRFCGACGARTASRDGGHRRDCEGCGRSAFPRTDAAVIGLVTRGERCLLVNQPQWPPRQLATIAGFLEPGESLEESMAREVREEVGLELTELRYVASQPWPFPASLMVGFAAEAAPGELRLSPEIRAARWLGREELAAALGVGEVTLANPVSIAFHLVARWSGDERALRALAAAAATP